MEVQSIPVASIHVPEGRRSLRGIEELAASITELGLLQPILVTPGHVLVAGYHRLEACKSLGWENIPTVVYSERDHASLLWQLAEIDENLIRNELTAIETGEHFIRRDEILKQLGVRAEIGQGRPKNGAESAPFLTTKNIAEQIGMSERTSQEYRQIATKLSPEVKELVRDTPFADSKTDLLRLARMEPEKQIAVAEKLTSGAKCVMDAERLLRHDEVSQMDWPEGTYRVIYADCPWKYDHSNLNTYGHAESHYDSLSTDELCLLPVPEMAASNAVLFLWATSPKLPDALKVIEAWGFEYKTSFVWYKIKHNYGHYNSVRHEFLLIATRGSCLPDVPELIDSVQTIERSDTHSEKPEEFRQIIDRLYPHGSRIELFARAKCNGWETWGNECN